MNESRKATGGRLTSGSRLCEDLDVRLPYLKQHGGGCMAYSTLAEDVEAFVVPDLGYVAYARQRLLGERVFVLADPIAPPERWGEILDLFLAQRPRAVFVQIGERTAALLRERGRVVNEMGTETDIDVPSFKLSASKRKSVTYMCNVAKRSAPVLREIPAAELPHERLRAISDEWSGTRSRAAPTRGRAGRGSPSCSPRGSTDRRAGSRTGSSSRRSSCSSRRACARSLWGCRRTTTS